jgi:preprotein translocase subunit SecA
MHEMSPFTRTAELPIPGLLLGAYPERRHARRADSPVLPAWVRLLGDGIGALEIGASGRFVAQVRACEQALQGQGAERVGSALRALRLALGRDGFRSEHVAQAFALVGLTSSRLLGVRPFDTQLIAGRIVLDNRLAEMATGEGKTLAVALAAATAALAGIPVHVITANDYLVTRDAEQLAPLYRALGLSTGAVTQPQDAAQRRAAYACDITYCTAKELVFDYLRDGLHRTRDPLRWRLDQLAGESVEGPVLRGLCMAIIDEADSILIDEARVPLILSHAEDDGQRRECLVQSLDLARAMRAGADFRLDETALRAELTDSGRERLEHVAASLPPMWRNRLHREETVGTALAALHLYRPDRHYLVREGKVQIVDETTGRVAPGRAWSRGLHQLIELKEGCVPSAELRTAAQITYQRFFPRYLRLGGLSGTLREARAELLAVYRLSVRRVPLSKPCRRVVLPRRLLPDRASLWDAVAARVAGLHGTGRPVLVGTDSVADSEALARRLTEAGLPHAVLNARHDGDEARIVAQAGARGAITVATNMAGRGTDIPLADDVAELGGLHIICCQLNAARRIDRQLAGRAARQGDRGSVETWLSLDAPLLAGALPRRLIPLLRPRSAKLPQMLLKALVGLPQRHAERRHLRQRKYMFEHDQRMDRQLSFGGPHE